MDLNRVRAAVQELERQGQVPSVRRVRALIGRGSMRDVVRLLAELGSQDGASLAANGNTLEPEGVRPGEGPSAKGHEAQEQPAGDFTGAQGAPPRKVYVCTRYPSLWIRHVRFTGGLLVTSDPEVQALIESTDLYGVDVYIHPEL
jgi:hypothetical protein